MEKPVCLFTSEELPSENKIEHTILRSLGGRIKSKTVTSANFNERSSTFDKLLSDQYKMVTHTLAPLLPKESNPGALEMTLDNGWPVILQNGVTSLRNMQVTDRYESGKPKSCYFPNDPKQIKRIAKKQQLKLDHSSIVTEPLPGKINFYSSTLCTPEAEISILKCILCSFDGFCQTQYPDFIFTRTPNLHRIRNFVRETILARDSYIDINELDRFYLGVQIDKVNNVKKAVNYFRYERGPYEHIILLSTNSATKSIDVYWDVLGIEIHGVRLTCDWNREPFCGMIVNPILKNTEYHGILKIGEENPYITIDKTIFKSFACGSKNSGPPSIIPNIRAELKKQAYYDAVAFSENNADEFLRKRFLHCICLSENAEMNIIDFVKSRLFRHYNHSYKNRFEEAFANAKTSLQQYEKIPSKQIKTFSDEQWKEFLADYRTVFNSLDTPMCRPGYQFTQEMDIKTTIFSSKQKKP